MRRYSCQGNNVGRLHGRSFLLLGSEVLHRNVALLSVMAIIGLSCVLAWGAEQPSAGPSGELADSAYNHFLFTTLAGEGVEALILAEVQPSTFATREVARAERFGRVFCVVGGRAYFEHLGKLYSLDLATGERQDLATVSPHCRTFSFADNRLYSAIRNDGVLTTRIHDFTTRAWRDVRVLSPSLEKTREDLLRPGLDSLAQVHGQEEAPSESPRARDEAAPNAIAVSPDHTQLAFFDSAAPSLNVHYMLAVVDLTETAMKYAGPVVDYFNASSEGVFFPPYLWLDSNRVIFVRNLPATQGSVEPVWLSSIDTRTGRLEDIVEVPCRPVMDGVELTRLYPDMPVYVETTAKRYRVDMGTKTLMEDDGIAAGFSFARRDRQTEVSYQGRLVERMAEYDPRTGGWHRIDQLHVSPDGNRALMTVSHYDQWVGPELRFYDVGQGRVRVAPDAGLKRDSGSGGVGLMNDQVCWIADEDLESAAKAPEAREGWTAF